VDEELYFKRLNFELSVILEMNFPGYFLIVSDFIRWAKENDIPVGPGRGSGAGSLVAWALSITNVDPIEHELLFERFLNPERVSMPDFDIDFCTDRRDEVIAYVASKYGTEKVSQIITYGTMAAKGVVRDVGRVLGHHYGFCDTLSKLIPNELKMTLDKALDNSPELKSRYDSEESVTTLIDFSQDLEGLIRNVGTHAGGVVIAPSKISDFCPVYKGPNEEDVVVSQFDKDDVEAVGLVKFDFLGLSNLTVIDKAVKIIRRNKLTDKLIDIDKLKLDDPEVYKLLQRCDTTGVFQLESEGMRGYLKKLQADCFEDIVAMLALYRPGPLDAGMVDDYIDVKHGARVKYPHPMLEEILKSTNGIFLYQEQVMKSAQVMAGYSLGGADLLRRAMGKKKPEEMAKQRQVFVDGAAKKEINEKKANEIFDLIDTFSGYGFNKSHSVAYAYISYQTAWLKTHFPAPFMAAVLSGVMDDTDRIAFTINECIKIGLIISPPNVCQSDYEFSITDNKSIVYGLGAIKGVGEAFVKL
jgi:DNA polymerase-3 subunit alpha